jgi:hypothetical protein
VSMASARFHGHKQGVSAKAVSAQLLEKNARKRLRI